MNLVGFNRIPFTEEEVLKVCKDIDVSKSASIDNIKTFVLKDVFLAYVGRLTKIFNMSYLLTIFPKKWKMSTIVPLPKVTNPKYASDLRPVALTPLPGKLLEKLVCGRLQTWLAANNILTKSQHGFRKKRSTISAIVNLLGDTYNHINNKRNPYIVFLDLKKAFDTISHAKMIEKLNVLGLDVTTISWFKNYLSGRQQCTRIGDKVSSVLPITFGVPQGSILGPILFSIYINEIVDIVNCGVVLYADDTVLYHHDSKVLQDNLNMVSAWCNNNLLTVNVKKSHWMKLRICGNDGEAGAQNDQTLALNGVNLKEVDTYKYLGLHIDNKLTFQQHHKKVVSSVNLKLTHFRRIRGFINLKAAILIYKCTILPVLEYADFVQDQNINYTNKALQKLQNSGLSIAHDQHILPFNRRDSSETLHRKSNVFRLIHRRKIHLLNFVYQLKEDISLLDVRDIPTRRRDGILFRLAKCNHFKFLKNPLYRCMVEWNNLPVNVSLLPTKDSLSRAVKSSIRTPFAKVLF